MQLLSDLLVAFLLITAHGGVLMCQVGLGGGGGQAGPCFEQALCILTHTWQTTAKPLDEHYGGASVGGVFCTASVSRSCCQLKILTLCSVASY